MIKWTDKELEFLIEECKRGELTIEQMSRRLGRSYMSTAGKLREMNLRVRVIRLNTYWNADRCERLARMSEQGASRREMARHFSVSTQGIEQQLVKMGLSLPVVVRESTPRGDQCKQCYIRAEFMAGCPRTDCKHYAEPLVIRERTLAGVGTAML